MWLLFNFWFSEIEIFSWWANKLKKDKKSSRPATEQRTIQKQNIMVDISSDISSKRNDGVQSNAVL